MLTLRIAERDWQLRQRCSASASFVAAHVHKGARLGSRAGRVRRRCVRWLLDRSSIGLQLVT